MSVLLIRGLAGVTLAFWLLSACLSEVVRFHVETDHHGHRHSEHRSLALLELHAAGDDAHKHEISSARGPGLASPRALALVPVLALQPVEWSDPLPLRTHHPVPIPRPRGSPERHTILLI